MVASLVLLHAAVVIAKFGFGHDHLLGMATVFDLNAESNVPTWYSASALLLCGIALAAVAHLKRRIRDPFTLHWFGLAAIFVYMSVDEVSRFHEHWGTFLEGPLSGMRGVDVLGGAFRNLWVLPAAVVVASVGFIYIRFLWHLPTRTRNRFVVAGALFVFASVGMEMVGAHFTSTGRRQHFAFMVLVTIEEILEMGSIVYFFREVLAYIDRSFGPVQIRFAEGAIGSGIS